MILIYVESRLPSQPASGGGRAIGTRMHSVSQRLSPPACRRDHANCPKIQANRPPAPVHQAQTATETGANNTPLLPLGALLLAGTLGTAAVAQTPPAAAPATAGTLDAVTVRDTAIDDGATTSKTLLARQPHRNRQGRAEAAGHPAKRDGDDRS
jgi:hypothetical protein